MRIAPPTAAALASAVQVLFSRHPAADAKSIAERWATVWARSGFPDLARTIREQAAARAGGCA